LAALIEANYDTVDGFVILHGSDTMAFTRIGIKLYAAKFG
jgi:L-asparaginase